MALTTKIENMVCFIDLKQDLLIDDKTAQENGLQPMKNLSGYLFHPSEDSKKNFMIFPSGKVFLNGATSREDLENSFWLLVKKLKTIGVKIKLKPDTEIVVENLMVSATLKEYLPEKEKINLEKLAQAENTDYDPEKFPGIFLRFFNSKDNSKVPMLGTAILFPSGKILVGDVKNLEDANLILEKVIEKVR